ncbi:hypothetical protein CS022_21820 [Veronia nyctiphanis]|uniref:Uncharacterized protein n=1 Tax=Veronia nyctiphanis TaxID=1278244 RepID=A0A4Q0YM26_9GAMM|nr:hypothetical protein [Veronia nyctiphanis]RXJ71044.1 hypothetical protein CS022_21820 [Veronia nyctiphanis]
MNSKKKNPDNKKDSQLVIRINGEQRDQFIALCEELDTSAAREIRRFIKQYLKENADPDVDQ